ncbi:MAG: hypothetical protein ACOC3I_01715 [Verrucomicrobiota bacterium]
MSPAGTHLAFRSTIGDSSAVTVLDLATGKTRGVKGSQGQELYSFGWVDRDYLAYELVKWDVYTMGIQLYDIAKDRITHFKSEDWNEPHYSLVDTLPDVPEKVLVRRHPSEEKYSNAYHMDLVNDRRETVARNPGKVVGWIPDRSGEVRFGVSYGRDQVFVHAHQGADTWTRWTMPGSFRPDPRAQGPA